MKRIRCFLIVLSVLITSFMFKQTSVAAAEIIGSTEQVIFDEKIGSIEIYSNGKVEIEYKYGLRKIDMYYCVAGEECDNGEYSYRNIMESSADQPYKNESAGMGTYEFNANLPNDVEYRVRVEVYFGTSNFYSGAESVEGSFTVGAVQIADTKENYINGESSNGIGDSRISKLMKKVGKVVNTLILPIVYSVTGLVLVVKGALLGIQIVKNADDPSIRKEKLGSLKWLIIGVAVTFLAATAVGAVSGFFKNAFGL